MHFATTTKHELLEAIKERESVAEKHRNLTMQFVDSIDPFQFDFSPEWEVNDIIGGEVRLESASGTSMKILFRKIPDGAFLPLHTHPIAEIVTIHKGTCIIQEKVNGHYETHILNPEDSVLIRAGRIHNCLWKGETEMTIHWFTEPPDIQLL
jgi:quercetin dioxygenase-like cupin family protein